MRNMQGIRFILKELQAAAFVMCHLMVAKDLNHVVLIPQNETAVWAKDEGEIFNATQHETMVLAYHSKDNWSTCDSSQTLLCKPINALNEIHSSNLYTHNYTYTNVSAQSSVQSIKPTHTHLIKMKNTNSSIFQSDASLTSQYQQRGLIVYTSWDLSIWSKESKAVHCHLVKKKKGRLTSSSNRQIMADLPA